MWLKSVAKQPSRVGNPQDLLKSYCAELKPQDSADSR